MSVPYGVPPRQPAAPGSAPKGRDLNFILAMVAAGAGAVGYIIGFFDGPTSASLSGLSGLAFLVAAALAGMRALPNAPNTLYAAAPLSLYGALTLLQALVGGGPSGVLVVLLLLVIAQLGALVAVLLLEAGVLTAPTPKSAGPMPRQQPPMRPGQYGQPNTGPFQQQPPFGQGPAAAPQPGSRAHPGQGQPQPPAGQGQQPWAPTSPSQQPGGWNPQSGGTPQPGTTGQPGSTGQSGSIPQPGTGQSGQQSSGPQGTQQMPHPGSPPSGY